jgi:hypothetical protein
MKNARRVLSTYAHQSVLEERREPHGGERATLRVLKFLPRASDAPRHARDGARLTDHVWSLEELVGLLNRRGAEAV